MVKEVKVKFPLLFANYVMLIYSIIFLQNYPIIMNDYYADDQDHSISVSKLFYSKLLKSFLLRTCFNDVFCCCQGCWNVRTIVHSTEFGGFPYLLF